MLSYQEKLYKGGFNFENSIRNSLMISDKDLKSQFRKTGTTIVGVTCREGVVLAADTRATANHVAEKNCNKVHFIAPNITCCGAGTAADNEYFTKKLSAELELLRMNTGRESKVSTLVSRASAHLFRYGGNIGAYLIIAGFDSEGPHLCQVAANG
jgi:20S proteasome subunit beta 2